MATWRWRGQFGKTAQVDPYMNVVVGPMLLTTAGAINQLDNFETFKMLGKRFNDIRDVKLFGSAHLSFYRVPVKKRLLENLPTSQT